MAKFPTLKAKVFLKYLIKYGAIEVSIKGSHHKITYNGITTVIPIHGNSDIDRKFAMNILGQVAIDIDDFLNFINKI